MSKNIKLLENSVFNERILVAMQNETIEDVVSFVTNEQESKHDWDREFTLWTKNKVYFLAQYDGEYWVDSVSRNPDGEVTDAVGG